MESFLPKLNGDLHGYVTIQDSDFYLQFSGLPFKKRKQAHVECEPRLSQALRPFSHTIKLRLNQSSSLDNFLLELKDVSEKIFKSSISSISSPSYYAAVVQDLEAIGLENIINIDENFANFTYQILDPKRRKHDLKIFLSKNYPEEAPTYSCQLPRELKFQWSKSQRLSGIIQAFEQAVASYQSLWQVLEDFDKNTWIIEPVIPKDGVVSLSISYRRVVIERACSIQIELNKESPQELCDIRFLGPDAVVQSLKERYQENIRQWDAKLTPRENLEKVLKIKFPSPKTSSRDDFSIECGICYSYKLEEEVPERICDNDKCSRPFHKACLYQWLKSLPSSRESFGTVFGECPYCSYPLTAVA